MSSVNNKTESPLPVQFVCCLFHFLALMGLQQNREEEWRGWAPSPCSREREAATLQRDFSHEPRIGFVFVGFCFWGCSLSRRVFASVFTLLRGVFFFFNMSVEFCRMLSLNLLKWTCCPLFLINVIETLNIKLLYIPGIIASGPYPS